MVAITLGVFTTSRSYEKLTANAWPTTDAQVLSNGLYKQDKSGLWCHKLTYRYHVDGKSFSSRQLSTSLLSRSGCDRDRQVIAARLERWQPGARIKIRYQPGNPGTSIVYLDELDATDYLFAAITLMCLAGGVKGLRDAAAMRGAMQARAARHQHARTDRFTHH